MNRPSPPRRIVALLAAIALGLGAATVDSCGFIDTSPAKIWTDVPEIALCAELFNDSQKRFLIEVQWKSDLVAALRQTRMPPALAIGRFLRSQGIRGRFLSLDYLFDELVVNQSAFYPELLDLGNVEGRQILLPVSFDLPAIVFPRGTSGIRNDFTLGLGDLAGPAKAYNQRDGANYVRMGFSPRWNGDFLDTRRERRGSGLLRGETADLERPGAFEERHSRRPSMDGGGQRRLLARR